MTPAPIPSPELIANLFEAQFEDVRVNWAMVYGALDREGCAVKNIIIATLANIYCEARSFKPETEPGTEDELIAKYKNNTGLGNISPADCFTYRGRGFYQITGRHQYGVFQKICSPSLITFPDLAARPDVAAIIVGKYTRIHGIDVHAMKGDWETCRRQVNGGLTDFSGFIHIVDTLSPMNLPWRLDRRDYTTRKPNPPPA